MVIQNNLKGFLATLPGVVGSTVDVKTFASIQAMSAASVVVKSVVSKAVRAQAQTAGGKVTAQAVKNTQLPPQINVCVAGQLLFAGRFNGSWIV